MGSCGYVECDILRHRADSWRVIEDANARCEKLGIPRDKRAKYIDEACPFKPRKGRGYAQWLKVRREFFIANHIFPARWIKKYQRELAASPIVQACSTGNENKSSEPNATN